MGRKSTYDKAILPAVEMWARDGLIDEEIATKLGVHVGTIYDWKKKYPEFANALKRSKEIVDAEVEQALFNATKKGDTTAMIFWLKNRQPGKWRDKRNLEIEGDIEIHAGFDDELET